MSGGSEWRPSVRPDAVWTMVEDEAVVVLPDQAKAEVLNPTGARVLALSDGSRTTSEIADAIAAEFDVDADAAARDVLAFLGTLVRLGIVSSPEAAE